MDQLPARTCLPSHQTSPMCWVWILTKRGAQRWNIACTKHSTKSCPTLPGILLLPLSYGVLNGCAVPELTLTATLHRPARLTFRSLWISRPPCSVNASAAAVFAPLPITTPSPSHCLCAAGRETTPYTLSRPFPPELMRRYGRHSQHRQGSLPSLWRQQSLGLFRCPNQQLLDRITFFRDYLCLYFNSPLFKRLSASDGDGSGQHLAMDDA